MTGAPVHSPPRVSVICIFYQAERFFAEAIDSVLAQTFTDFELLLADDGSTDGGTEIALDYAGRDSRVRYLEHPGHANLGMSATRNLGLAHATGDLVAFIDSDDVWRPGKLAAQVAVMDADPELGMVCGAVNYWDSWEGGEDRIIPTGPVRDARSDPPDTSLAIYPLGKAPAPCPSDVMIRRSVLDRVGGFEAHFSGARQLYEDQGAFAKIYLAAPVYFSSRVWLDYRQHAESCVATVHRDGRYAEVRRYWIDWFERYLPTCAAPGKDRVAAALRRARWQLDRPRLAKVVRRLGF